VMTFRLQIPNLVIGSVIGKQGETVKAIRGQSRAKVNIRDSQPGEDRDVLIKGTVQAVDQAVNLIIANICQGRNQSFVSDQSNEENFSLKVVVGNDQAGAIIGKGGEVIKRLREESGARIMIGKKVEFVRTVTVSGNVNSVRAAFAVLIRLVHEHPTSSRDPFLQGQGYRQPAYRSNQSSYNYSPSNYSYGIPPAPPVVAPNHSQYASEATSLTLSVPNRSVGAIIGRGGQTINEIRTVSGCRIDISPQTDGSQFRAVTLTGSSQSIEVAHLLIQKYAYVQHQ